MKVLSLFDGIACGRVALERAGIPVEEYHAFEIDNYAIQIAKKNYPDIIHHGDVFEGDFTQFKDFDLLLGGSPCTYWSIAKAGRETTPDGIGGQLFMQYVRALKESGCRYFLYENNYSIHKNIKAFISEQLGVEPIMINSALCSAQSRKRCYWTNIPHVTHPKDKGILLKDVLESGIDLNAETNGKSRTIKAQYSRTSIANCVRGDNLGATMVAEPILLNDINGKSKTLRASMDKDGIRNLIGNEVDKRTCIAEPVRIGTVDHGGNKSYDSKQWRVYSVKGKSVTLYGQGGGAGAKTGLYKIDLPDGDYIIRKLTPLEAERLQTLPDNYTEGISDTQRYKCIGNGWTVDVIAWILGGLKDK